MANAPTFTGKVSAKGFDAGGEKITNVAPGDVSASSTDAVNGSQLYAIGGAIINNNTAITNNSIAISNNSANIGYNTYNISKNAGKINDNRKQINTNRAAIGKGINIGSDSGEMVNRQLGDVIAFSGDRNITTKTTKKGLQVTLNPDLTADSLRAGNTLVNHDGVRISGGNNGDIMLTNNGLDNGGNRVKSIAAGINDTDAVNVSQLKEAYRHIDGVKDDASAGIAAAIAMANMPQPHDPGASMMSLGVGAHRDQQAIAIGLSTISDNGKWILKGSLSQDTQSNVSAGVGVGYQW
ncbi:MAG: hypothetical protein CSA45_01330 [Gammaproteobacteria bacterium]|nr:MAG: hypothetical protein CSA45_01330 [Gammaproteobacteria bacterium]